MLEGKPEGAGAATSLRSLLAINTIYEIYHQSFVKKTVVHVCISDVSLTDTIFI